jgi:prevent-host-death family protein
MTTVSMREARARFAEIIERARTGEPITVARNGAPQVELTPVVGSVHKPRMTRADMVEILQGGGMDFAAWEEINSLPGGWVSESGTR